MMSPPRVNNGLQLKSEVKKKKEEISKYEKYYDGDFEN